jgi:hypothetical protein
LQRKSWYNQWKKKQSSYIWIVVLVVGLLSDYQFYLKQHQNRFETILNPAISIEEKVLFLETQLTTPDAKESQVQQVYQMKLYLNYWKKLTVLKTIRLYRHNFYSETGCNKTPILNICLKLLMNKRKNVCTINELNKMKTVCNCKHNLFCRIIP